jgi:biopolymer transport protein ExbB
MSIMYIRSILRGAFYLSLLFVVPMISLAQEDIPSPAPAAEEEPMPANEFERWASRLGDAGATVPVLFLLSVLGVACILERMAHLRRARVAPPGLVEEILPLYGQGQFDEIQKRCAASDSTLGRVASFMVEHRHWNTDPLALAAGDVASRELRRHLIRAYPLAIIGALAPLLGLLGTVSGMVDAFDAVAIAGLGDVQVLGSSISKALVTTLVGLVVAIPSLFAYHLFKSKTQLLGVVLEEQAADMVNAWFMKKETSTEESA